ncbi:MAG TPA: hypothetical protein VJ850_12550 [Candidatus Limnocylindrales bacterium]|nr:hypothetical protein [Candidatus Limnocylindrales bacterium]
MPPSDGDGATGDPPLPDPHRAALRVDPADLRRNARAIVRRSQPARLGILRPPAVYLTVEDLEGFAAALTELGIPGEDRRRRR